MSRDRILTGDDGARYSLDNIRTQGWLNGHYGGLDDAVNWLREQAVALFRDGKDEQAVALRKLAERMGAALQPKMRLRAEEHERDFPMRLGVE